MKLRHSFAGLVIAGLLLAVGCARPTDSSLRERDQQILAQFERAQQSFGAQMISAAQYREELRVLRADESKLMDEARQHEFRDIAESNYWHRGRLKFPSRIEQELEHLQEGANPPH